MSRLNLWKLHKSQKWFLLSQEMRGSQGIFTRCKLAFFLSSSRPFVLNSHLGAAADLLNRVFKWKLQCPGLAHLPSFWLAANGERLGLNPLHSSCPCRQPEPLLWTAWRPVHSILSCFPPFSVPLQCCGADADPTCLLSDRSSTWAEAPWLCPAGTEDNYLLHQGLQKAIRGGQELLCHLTAFHPEKRRKTKQSVQVMLWAWSAPMCFSWAVCV